MKEILNRFKSPRQSGVRQALFGDAVVASASDTQRVDGYEYFAPEGVNWEFLEPSAETSVCHWKGVATYYDVVVGDVRYPAAAWTYEDPSEAASALKGHVGFWRGVRLSTMSETIDDAH